MEHKSMGSIPIRPAIEKQKPIAAHYESVLIPASKNESGI